jgi:hypothetical protein
VTKVQLQQLTRSEVQSDPAIEAIAHRHGPGAALKASVSRPLKPLLHDLDRAVEWFVRTQTLGGGRGLALLIQGGGEDVRRILGDLWHKTNIPARFEIMAVNDGLKDAGAALRLLEALLAFIDAPSVNTFTTYSDAVRASASASNAVRCRGNPLVANLRHCE